MHLMLNSSALLLLVMTGSYIPMACGVVLMIRIELQNARNSAPMPHAGDPAGLRRWMSKMLTPWRQVEHHSTDSTGLRYQA